MVSAKDAIEVQCLTRQYKAQIGILRLKAKMVLAVDNVNFTVGQGELFGILGPNGAGKTTIVKILTTLLIPTTGEVRVLGYDVVREASQIRAHIGFVFGGERGLYWRLSAYDNLVYFANLYHVPANVQKN